MRCPEFVSLIFELLGEMLYPLDTTGAKFVTFCLLAPFIAKDAKEKKMEEIQFPLTYLSH